MLIKNVLTNLVIAAAFGTVVGAPIVAMQYFMFKKLEEDLNDL